MITFVDSLLSAERFELRFEQLPATLGRCCAGTVEHQDSVPGAESFQGLEDRWVSRTHCEILIEDGHLVVRDLSSRHGTFINGEPVQEAILCPGDELQLGVHNYRVDYRPRHLLRQAKRLSDAHSQLETTV